MDWGCGGLWLDGTGAGVDGLDAVGGGINVVMEGLGDVDGPVNVKVGLSGAGAGAEFMGACPLAPILLASGATGTGPSAGKPWVGIGDACNHAGLCSATRGVCASMGETPLGGMGLKTAPGDAAVGDCDGDWLRPDGTDA